MEANILPKHKKKFIDEFGYEFGVQLYDFYRKNLDFGGQKKYSTEKISLTERRFRHAKYLVDNFGKEAVSKSIPIFIKKLESGYLSRKSKEYFEKIVENSRIQDPEIKISEKIIPVPIRRQFDEFEREFLNWIYTCPNCNEEIDAWADRCPKCDALCLWGEVLIG